MEPDVSACLWRMRTMTGIEQEQWRTRVAAFRNDSRRTAPGYVGTAALSRPSGRSKYFPSLREGACPCRASLDGQPREAVPTLTLSGHGSQSFLLNRWIVAETFQPDNIRLAAEPRDLPL